MFVPLALSFALEANQLTQAPPAELTVLVTCALLSPEQTASVEARLQADWLAEGSPGGQLTLSCPDDHAAAHFEGTGHPIDVEEPRAPDQPVDALLRVAYRIASELRAAEGPPEPEPAAAPPPPPPPTEAPKGQPAPSRRVPRDAESLGARQSTTPMARSAFDVGVIAEHWGTPSGTLGLDFGIERQWTDGLALRGRATLATGWGVPDELDVKSLTPSLLLVGTIIPEWLALRAGPTFSVMSFSGESLEPQRVTSTSLAAEIEAVLTPPMGAPRPWLSLGLRFYARDRRIIVGDEERLHVPRAAALLGLGLRI